MKQEIIYTSEKSRVLLSGNVPLTEHNKKILGYEKPNDEKETYLNRVRYTLGPNSIEIDELSYSSLEHRIRTGYDFLKEEVGHSFFWNEGKYVGPHLLSKLVIPLNAVEVPRGHFNLIQTNKLEDLTDTSYSRAEGVHKDSKNAHITDLWEVPIEDIPQIIGNYTGPYLTILSYRLEVGV